MLAQSYRDLVNGNRRTDVVIACIQRVGKRKVGSCRRPQPARRIRVASVVEEQVVVTGHRRRERCTAVVPLTESEDCRIRTVYRLRPGHRAGACSLSSGIGYSCTRAVNFGDVRGRVA